MGKVLIALLLCLAIGAACSGGGSGVSPSGSPSTSASPRSSVHSGGAAVSPTQAATGELPSRELMDLAQRFRGLSADTPRIARTSPYGHAVGDSAKFTLLNLTAPGLYTVTATVRRVTDHAYFFVQDDVMYGDPALDKISSDFESTVWPTVTGDFGEPWTPGVDSDPRITILHAKLNGAGGYFSQSDEYPVVVAADSNEREMVYLDAGTLGNPGPGYNSLLAHELQHLIHWHADPTEESWVNEGLSQVSAEEVGGGLEWLQSFLEQPDTQLTYWPALEDSGIHYAESELFNAYVLDHYGGRAKAKELLAKQGDGIDGINEYLAPYGKTFAGVFADWVVANYLAQPEGLYSNTKIRSAVTAITNVGPGPGDSTVHQFGSDYLLITNPVPGSVLSFQGSASATIGVPDAQGGFWWSGRGDAIDTKLTREVDLTGTQKATLRFRTWYQIERGWDYGYVAASTDGGATWRALPGKQTSDYNPVQVAYGRGYTGSSSGWVQEETDLSQFAGQKVLLRFEYVSDDATSLTGFAVDDIQVPEIGFSDDASGDSGWQADGFQHVTGQLPQQFIVQEIAGTGSAETVTRVPLDASNKAEIAINGPTVIVVSGATENTTDTAAYHWNLKQP